MTDGEKKQVKKMLFYTLIGYITGAVLKRIECLIWTSSSPVIDLIKGFTIPVCTLLGVVIFLYFYLKDKEN